MGAAGAKYLMCRTYARADLQRGGSNAKLAAFNCATNPFACDHGPSTDKWGRSHHH